MLDYHESALAGQRAALIRQIRAKPDLPAQPAPKVETAAQAQARWRRAARLAYAKRVLALVEGNVRVATLIGCSPRCVAYWRAGKRSPTIPHWRQMQALLAVLVGTGAVRFDTGIRIVNRGAGGAASRAAGMGS